MSDRFPEVRITRRACAVLFLALLALAAAGSLTPFDFQPLPLSTALHLFVRLRFAPEGRISLSDMICNILLFIPLGFALRSALDAGRVQSSRWETIWRLAFALGSLSLVSAALEFGQIFVPSRMVAGSDILSGSVGAALGVGAHMLTGPRLVIRLEHILAGRDRTGITIRLLLVYAFAFFVFQMFPFDVTIRPTELAEKYRYGRVQLNAFGFIRARDVHAALHLVGLSVTAFPIGVLAAIAWPPAGRQRDLKSASLVAILVVGFTTAAQLFIYSRASRIDELLALSVGTIAGVVCALRLQPKVTSLS